MNESPNYLPFLLGGAALLAEVGRILSRGA